MKLKWFAPLIASAVFSSPLSRGAETGPAATEPASPSVPLVRDGRPACTILMPGTPEPGWLVQHGAGVVRDTIRRWSGVDVPVILAKSPLTRPPSMPAIVLATVDDLRHFFPSLAGSNPVLTRASFLDEQGFICTTQSIAGAQYVLVVGRTARGVYNGAVYLRDFCIDGNDEDLYLACGTVVRNPQLPGRAAYTLTIWGREAEYTADDWATIFDSFARDGFDRVYFWVSGHFPSVKFPNACKCRNNGWDTTAKSRIATLDDLRKIVRAAHDRGLKLYAGGALGGWCCTYLLTDLEPGTTKTAPPNAQYPGPSSLCPSHPKSRQALIDYYQEIFDGLPEADGLFIESADEWGACVCPVCSRKIDDRGGTQFGQAQITLVQEIMQTVWRDHPHARLCYTIGYAEHRKDPAYYELVRRMSDPRVEWMEARDSWAFPGPEGQDLPASTFSRQVMRWRQYYVCPLEQLVKDTARISQCGMYGSITAFEPGAGTGSFHTQIPYPADSMPYILTGFVWREATWEPTPSAEAMRQRVQRRFFGRKAPAALAQDLWDLRELIREASGSRKMTAGFEQTLARIEGDIAQARSAAGPKTTETLDLMSKAIADTRAHLK